MRMGMGWRVGAIMAGLAPALLLGQGAVGTLAGTWQGTQTFQRGTRTITSVSTYVFKTDGNQFTGTSAGGTLASVTNGVIDGDRITFDVPNPYSLHAPPQQFTGALENGTLTLTRIFNAGRGRGNFTPPPPLELHKISDAVVFQLPAGLQHPSLPPLQSLPPNGLALTPPMGWNSWNRYNSKVNDQVIRQTADLLVSTGMRDAGYVYVNIDDTWEGTRDAQGNIQPNSKFPDMKALADYLHSKGLKLGIYSSPGPKTCAGYEASYNHETQDANTYAAWGVDYLKYDWCSASQVYYGSEMEQAYEKMALALRATGRPVVFSLCQYGDLDVWTWGASVGGNLWRTTGDIRDTYASMSSNGFSQNDHAPFAGPGHWNDPDMLEIGNGGMSNDEYKTHMSLWSILAAPLLAGNDLSAMTPDTLAILTNRDVIAVDQDTLGKQGFRVSQNGDLEVWKKPLAGGAVAVGLFNRGTAAAPMTVKWSDVGVGPNPQLRDLWTHKDFTSPDSYTVTVPSHGVVLLRAQ